jgi:hypothetical protein
MASNKKKKQDATAAAIQQQIGPPPNVQNQQDIPKPIGPPVPAFPRDVIWAPSPEQAAAAWEFSYVPPQIVGYGRGTPFYVQGDEWIPGNWSPEQIADVQAALKAAGWLSGSYRAGVWDTKSANAFENVLAAANASGLSWEEVLSMAAASGAGGGGSDGNARLGPAPISDDDIKALAQKMAQGVLGRNLRTDELERFIPAFRSVYVLGETSPQTIAENLVAHEVSPIGEAAAHQVGDALATFQAMLRGGK